MEEEPISAITGTAAELTLKEMKERDGDHKKVVKMKKERKKIDTVKGKDIKASEDGVMYCKKSDGKGWHCKRPAQLPHNFCSYHIAQIRAYSSNQKAANEAAVVAAASDYNGKNSSHRNEENVGVDSNFYYYYSGFGPWRGKRRGRAADVNNVSSSSKEMSTEHDDDEAAAAAAASSIAAGDDEFDVDCFDDDDDDEDCDYYGMKQDDGKNELVGDGMEKKVLKKRGRKPLKSRSLKSLL